VSVRISIEDAAGYSHYDSTVTGAIIMPKRKKTKKQFSENNDQI